MFVRVCVHVCVLVVCGGDDTDVGRVESSGKECLVAVADHQVQKAVHAMLSSTTRHRRQ